MMPTVRSESEVQPTPSPRKFNSQAWYRPTLSPEHGVYVVLAVSFLIGAAAAHAWTELTTLAFICALCGFQAEHPLVLQIKQRKSLKPRFLVWGGIYGLIAAAIALYLYFTLSTVSLLLLWLYGGAIAALGVDAVSVIYREQKSIINEFITFAAVCLSAPLAYVVTTGSLSKTAIALGILSTLFFSSSIFTVKLRKPNKANSPLSPVAKVVGYHTIASGLIVGLWYLGWLSPVTATAFSIGLFKAGLILGQQEWYRTTKIQSVAMLETGSALIFLLWVALSVLPARLPV